MKNNFPKFLYAKEEGRHFVIHTGFPRFIGEAIKKESFYDMHPELIDDFPVKAGDEMVMASLMREAGDFLATKI
jgi:hypothetical protein